MDHKFMIFFRESDFSYFLFNGKWPISVSPDGDPLVAGEFSTEARIEEIEKLVPQLQEVLQNNRKKTFTLNKARYVVSFRGVFHTE